MHTTEVNNRKRVVFITGATGVMGSETLREFSRRLDRFCIRLLARPGRKNRRKLAPYMRMEGITVVWGDLMNYDDVVRAMGDADVVLHIGGMVSPLADHYPDLALKVNTGAARNIVDAIKARPDRDDVRLVYIGSVAQTSHRFEPHHWGRTGDPVMAGVYDYYGISKIKAERIVAESGLRHWVSLRQSGILHRGLIFNGSDPISFHVPLRGVLEWATVEDSARLMANISEADLPDELWRNFFNIGSGAEFRLTNYQFEKLLLEALGCPPPEKVFETGWFATRNFHGQWYMDSDRLEKLVPFREKITAGEYFRRLSKGMPWWMGLTPLAPAFLIKWGMKQVARTRDLGTLDWLGRNDCEEKITAFFGSRAEHAGIPDWEDFDTTPPSQEAVRLDHGYDESKPEAELCIDDMRQAAEFRGGRCLSESMVKGDLDSPLEWECAFGHRFNASPRIVLKGGHWCPECLPAPWNYDEESRRNPFMAQVWHDSHDKEERMVYAADNRGDAS